MEVVITSLDALLQKATNASLERPDPASVEAFCTILCDTPNGAYIATRVIASRMKSNHPTESLLTLEVLDICMKRCDMSFRVEVDKFRFLNEMIKLVSPKYYGNKTPPAVKQKVLHLMHSWTLEYPRELKIRDAYEMLKKQGVIKDLPPSNTQTKEDANITPKPKNKDVLFQDEEKVRMLQKLLQSKNPIDIQAANRLIKTVVKEDERRVEAISRRITELQTVHNNARLLDEMLEQYKPGVSSPEDLDLIKELHGACLRLRPTVFKLAAETQHNEEMLNDVLEASDELTQVFNKYNTIVTQSDIPKDQTPAPSGESSSTTTNGESLLDLNTTTPAQPTTAAHSDLQALGDIFSSVPNTNVKQSNDDILKPISLMPECVQEKKVPCQIANKCHNALDDLGVDLIKASFGTSTFGSKESEKTPMNLLVKNHEKQNVSESVKNGSSSNEPMSGSSILDLDFLISKTLNKESQSGTNFTDSNSMDDEFMVDISSDDSARKQKSSTTTKENNEEISLLEYLNDLKKSNDTESSEKVINETNKIEDNKETNGAQNSNLPTPVDTVGTEHVHNSNVKNCEVKPLTDINISLDSITPKETTPIVAFEESDGVNVTLHFTKNKPRPDVSVIVLSTTSKNKTPIQDFKFHAVVPKGCKVRLLPQSGDSLSAYNPFLPPPAITQVMLIAHPADVKVYLKFVITYTCEDDNVSEMGEIDELPLFDSI